MWPEGKWTELATRLILGCTGSAFQKLQLKSAEITVNEKKSIQQIIELLGGQWGQIPLEKKYEAAERALFRCVQRQDETNDSFLARADVLWQELINKEVKLDELQAYITLRGSTLSAEDKKKVVIDSQVSTDGRLTMPRVSAAIRMLGAGFFHEITTGKKTGKLKTYDSSTMVADQMEDDDEASQAYHADVHEEVNEDEMIDVLVQEGDADAILIADFETAASDVLQGDEELASALNAYTEARRRLSEKVKSRGFWPLTQSSKGKSKGFNRGVKGKFNKGHNSSRKTLQQRILSSTCRICGKMGHWKAECPSRNDASGASRPQAPTSFVQVQSDVQGLPLEFLNLPSFDEAVDVPYISVSQCFVCHSERFKDRESKDRLQRSIHRWLNTESTATGLRRHDDRAASTTATAVQPVPVPTYPCPRAEPSSMSEHVAMFATYSSMGVVDLGATKTVIGSNLVKGLLEGLNPQARKAVRRCPCAITFRFGNQGTLQSEQALAIPIHGLWLKVAVVPGSTPFLLSNTLLRAIGAVIDTSQKTIFATKINKLIPIQLTDRGLFLLDLNDLVDTTVSEHAAETHQVSEETKTESAKPCTEPEITNSGSQASCHAIPATVDNMHTPSPSSSPTHVTDVKVENNSPGFPNILDEFLQQPEPCTEYTGSADPRSSSHSTFARSFRFPKCRRNVLTESAPEGTPSARRDRQVRFQSPEPQPIGRDQGGFRPSSPGPDLPRNVAEPSGLASLVCRKVREIREGESSEDSALCRVDGGTSRNGRHSHPCPQRGAIECDPEEAKGQSHAQEDSTTAGRGDLSVGCCGGGGVRDVWRRDRCRYECGRSFRNHGSECDPPGGPNGSPGECGVTDPHVAGSQPANNRAPVDPCPSWAQSFQAGDPDQTDNLVHQVATETNRERKMFNKMILQISQELDQVIQNSNPVGSKIDLLEVFCGPHSQLTSQCQQMGHRAMRFGLAEGDLQTSEGQRLLFKVLVEHRPKHAWFSPKCGPWSGWSNLNGSKSIKAWDELQNNRLQHLDQIAVGIVLMRYQRGQRNHFHWEQPQNSQMFRLPYMQEVRQVLLALDVDLCTAGDLRDPETQNHMRKALTIMTSSPSLCQELEGLKCRGLHPHQQIEGSCKVAGKSVLRTAFTENYPRKFARRLAKSLCRFRKPRELPYLLQHEVCLWSWTLTNESDHGERAPKRQRLADQARLKVSRAREVEQLPWGKRIKCPTKTTPQNVTQQWQSIFQELQQQAPRVGKIEITNPQIISQVQTLMEDKEIRRILICRGTNRTIAPPTDLMKGEAPYRRCVFIERNSGKCKADESWESWENLSKRQLIRASHPCRLNMTVFACNPEVPRVRESRIDTSDPGASNSASAPPVRTPEATEAKTSDAAPTESPNPIRELTESQQADMKMSSSQSAHFKSLTKEEQQALIRAHKNLGHPHAEKFSSILRQQGFRPEVARAALELKCSVCQAQQLPKTGAPGNLRDELDFNDRIHVDGFTWTNAQGKGFHVYHFVDSATSFQVASIAPSRAADAFLECFLQSWLMWAGTPHEMIIDAGTELNSDEVANFAQAHNIHMTTISTEAHFQNGKAERHGSILQNMLTKYETEHAIHTYHDLKQGLWWCTQAKNAYSIRKGFSPEILVLGKQTRLPGSNCSDELLPAHMLADSESAQGVQFRLQLARRESARKAFVQTDHDAALRRSVLRKSKGEPRKYLPGEWVMVWRQGKGAYPDQWTGPMKVVVHENSQTVWTTMAAKLFRAAPEHVRPVSAMEAKGIVMLPNEPTISQIAQQLSPHLQNVIQNSQSNNPNPDITLPAPNNPSPITPNNPNMPSDLQDPENQSEVQPDAEPGAPGSSHSPVGSHNSQGHSPAQPAIPNPEALNPEQDKMQAQLAQNTPVPMQNEDDDDLVCEGLPCVDVEPESIQLEANQAWQCEVYVTEGDIDNWKRESRPHECSFLATAAKRQRAEVKLTTLSPSERAEFQKAKENEIQNWLKTGTISRIMRDQVPPDQVLRCRWILTWKPIDEQEKAQLQGTKNHKAKARPVILGYLDPKIAEVPRDSPTLGRHSKMLLLQTIASKGWDLQSFDIKAAFLQGKNQKD